MEGPTPVSALIHAATMVTAGVFMVCRLSPMFEAAPAALTFVTFIGAATCFFAATIGTCQWDIKRVIAYSTCSQLGYMFFAAGVGAYGAAMFHLFTHAFFKALLFLGAGSVIHAMHHEQDMRYYGGLRKQIPITFWVMMAGTLAITGVGIAGVFGFAGFYSKDAIIEAAYASGTEMGTFAFWAGAFAALLTSFYSWRLMFLTFWGQPRWIESEHIQHAVHGEHDDPALESAGSDAAHHVPDPHHGSGTGGYHPHESPWTMLVPIGLLAIGAVFAGFVFYAPFIDGASFWNGAIAYNGHLIHAMEEIPLWAKWSATIAMVIGFVIAWMAYIRDASLAERIADQFGPIYTFVYNKWYFDELYHYVFVKPAFWLGRLFWHGGDEGIIDRFGPNGSAWVIDKGAVLNRRFQSGYLTNYALIMLVGLVAAVSWVMAQ
jgi:NADH-quinone oxidoreductase subunit L